MKNVTVKINSKEEAMAYKYLLESLGEPVSDLYWMDALGLELQNWLIKYSGEWMTTDDSDATTREVITIGELVSRLTAPKTQYVRVGNQVEYMRLMKLYKQKGWRWGGGDKPDVEPSTGSFPMYFAFKDGFTVTGSPQEATVTIEEVKAPLPNHITEDGLPIWFGDNFWGAYYNKMSGWVHLNYHGGPFELSRATPLGESTCKWFYTKEAATQWVKEHKKVTMTEDGWALGYGDKYYAVSVGEHTVRFDGAFVFSHDSGVLTDPANFKAFHTKEAAEEYAKKHSRVYVGESEEGTPLFEGDMTYVPWRTIGNEKYYVAEVQVDRNTVIGKRKYFALRHNAEAWVAEQNKPVLITTVDGVPLKEGDNFYHVFYARGYGYNRWELNYHLYNHLCARYVYTLDKSSSVFSKPETSKAFSTKEAAEIWIEQQNKPLLITTMDGVSLHEGDRYFEVFKWPDTDPWELNGWHDTPGLTYVFKARKDMEPITNPEKSKAFSTKAAAEAWIKKQNANPVLLTTEDGVGLTEDSPVHVARTSNGVDWFYRGIYPSLKCGGKWNVNPDTKEPNRRLFSTKEAAEAWIKEQNKPVLLTTVDGVDLREGDECYEVFKYPETDPWEFNNIMDENGYTEVFKVSENLESITDPETSKAFSTKEAAEAWIKEQNGRPK